jgi:hypothetical protein
MLLRLLGLVDWLLCIPLAFIFSKYDVYKFLYRLELGVFFFCWRQSVLAEAEKLEFAIALKEQAEGEHSHAFFFAQKSGQEFTLGTEYMFSREPRSLNWSIMNGTQVDGISYRFWAARVFFGGRDAASYDWEDKLCYMLILERFQSAFYYRLVDYFDGDAAYHLCSIAISEQLHGNNLGAIVQQYYPNSLFILLKWEARKYFAIATFAVEIILKRLFPFLGDI